MKFDKQLIKAYIFVIVAAAIGATIGAVIGEIYLQHMLALSAHK